MGPTLARKHPRPKSKLGDSTWEPELKKETTRNPEVKESKEKKSTDAPVRAFISYTFKCCCSRDEFHSKNEERRNRSKEKTPCTLAQFSVCSVKDKVKKTDYILMLSFLFA